jgi:hypothetical protein
MYKVHAPHLKSGYLAKVEFQEQRGESGELDWLMFYTPGRRARAEFREASKKPRRMERQRVTPRPELPAKTKQETRPAATIHTTEPDSEPLISKLIELHIAENTARELVRDYRKSVELQLRAVPYRNLNKIKNLAAWLVVAIKENHELPDPIIEVLAKEEEVRHAIAKKEAEQKHQKRRNDLQPAFYDYLRGRAGQLPAEQPEAYRAFLAKEAEERSQIENSRVFKPKLKGQLLSNFDEEESHLDRLREFFKEPTLDEWLESRTV